MNRLLFLCLAFAGLLACSGCASFERAWQEKPAAHASRDPFSGNYEGRWFSSKHRKSAGRLRCIVTRVDNTTCHARFHANWLIFASSYEIALAARQEGKVLHLEGQHDLGRMFGGIYRYKGRIKDRNFSATYASADDFGRFEMTRKLTNTAFIP